MAQPLLGLVLADLAICQGKAGAAGATVVCRSAAY